jgi:hypothetical protein
MRKWRRVSLQGIVWLTLIWGVVWTLSNRAEISEAFEVATCRVPCLALTPEQLRLEVIKAYLHRELDFNINSYSGGATFHKLVLLPRDMSAEDIVKSIKDQTLLAILTTDTNLLESHAQIDALTIESLAGDPSIAAYSLPHREVEITPTRSIRKATPTEVESYPRESRSSVFVFGWLERQRGYGQRFFWINSYWGLSLACCDGRGNERDLSPDWLNENSLRNVKAVTPRLMAVSDRGAILIRYYDGEPSILF